MNVRIPPDDLVDFGLASAWAGLSLNKWLLRAARQKFEQERLLQQLVVSEKNILGEENGEAEE